MLYHLTSHIGSSPSPFDTSANNCCFSIITPCGMSDSASPTSISAHMPPPYDQGRDQSCHEEDALERHAQTRPNFLLVRRAATTREQYLVDRICDQGPADVR